MSGCAGRASRLGNFGLSAAGRLRRWRAGDYYRPAGDGITVQGSQLAQTLGLVAGARLNRPPATSGKRRIRVLILGVNGFIGNHLTERLLNEENYEVYGMDIGSNAISRFLLHPRFHFVEGDISIHSEWIEYHVKNAMSYCRW